MLIQDGTLKKGDTVVLGTGWGRVRQMQDDLGKAIKEAGPSTPVQITGLAELPPAGAAFHVVKSDRVAKQIGGKKATKQLERRLAVASYAEPKG